MARVPGSGSRLQVWPTCVASATLRPVVGSKGGGGHIPGKQLRVVRIKKLDIQAGFVQADALDL